MKAGSLYRRPTLTFYLPSPPLCCDNKIMRSFDFSEQEADQKDKLLELRDAINSAVKTVSRDDIEGNTAKQIAATLERLEDDLAAEFKLTLCALRDARMEITERAISKEPLEFEGPIKGRASDI